MKNGSCVFLGTFAAMCVSWCLMIFFPTLQLGSQQAVVVDDFTGATYPPARPGVAAQGREIYRANGCNYCHTQQVFAQSGGPGNTNWIGADIQRGWGKRWSVAQDYLNDEPVLLGSKRIGPDLANIGVRRPDDDKHTNTVWQLRHLYNPQLDSPGSIMPPYPYLFKKQKKLTESGSPDALTLPDSLAPDKNHEIVPKPEAIVLVQYLFSLRQDVALFEAPFPVKPKPPGGTNSAAGTNKLAGTNAPVGTNAVKPMTTNAPPAGLQK